MKFLLMLTMFSLVACSGSKSAKDIEEMDGGIELADSDEFSEEGAEDVVADNMEADDDMAEDSTEMASSPMIDPAGEIKTYAVQKNETLMIIAFKLYGDYSKWKDIAQANNMNGNDVITAGSEIKYIAPVQEFVWQPDGNPYLIKNGDTLGTISTDVYGANKFWKDIWTNNKPLIKDPNKIYAGFTLYTPIIEGRDVAFDN